MMESVTRKLITTSVVLASLFMNGYSQTDTVKTNAYDGMSLKDLLNVKIVSVSKTSELLFDAPLSASVVTKEEIQQSGCTSVMEALRLVPGMIIREESNGNFDIQMRGVYMMPNSPFDGNAVPTLVMIDNRPIFNYLKGSTFWESLPVDLNDIERIEVIRGPAGALYGPNAVNGVINIITRQIKKDGLYATANSALGNYHTAIENASIGYKSDKWSVIASGNYQFRNRTQTSYFEMYRNQLFNHPDYFINALNDTMRDVNTMFPRPRVAVEKSAGNVFINYDPKENVHYNFSAGIEHALVQRVSSDNGITPLSTVHTDSRYAELKGNIGALTGQFSYIDGTQIPDHQPGNKYDFNTFDGSVWYNYTKGNFSLKPSLSYRSAVYDDTRYSDTVSKSGIFNSRGQITTFSAATTGEYKLFDNKLRMVAGLKMSAFNYPNEVNLSWEFAATWKINKRHLLRAVFSQAPRSSDIYDTYVNQNITGYQTGYQRYAQLRLEGNKDLQLLTARMLEIGYRGRIAPQLQADVEAFYIYSKNYSSIILSKSYTKLNGPDTIDIVPIRPTNLPLTVGQFGVTASLTFTAVKWQVKPFVTWQQSKARNYAPFNNAPDAEPGSLAPNPVQNNIYSGMGSEMVLTDAPSVFGGVTANYRVTSKLNANMNAYFYSRQTILHSDNLIFHDGVRGIDHIPAKLIINATLSYQAAKGLQVYGSLKNLLNDKSREFFRTDAIPLRVMGGISFEL
jgi:iron complex outermembrane receptor protein